MYNLESEYVLPVDWGLFPCSSTISRLVLHFLTSTARIFTCSLNKSARRIFRPKTPRSIELGLIIGLVNLNQDSSLPAGQ